MIPLDLWKDFFNYSFKQYFYMNMRVDKYGKCGTTELQKAKAGDEKRNVRGVIQHKTIDITKDKQYKDFRTHSAQRCDLIIAGVHIL